MPFYLIWQNMFKLKEIPSLLNRAGMGRIDSNEMQHARLHYIAGAAQCYVKSPVMGFYFGDRHEEDTDWRSVTNSVTISKLLVPLFYCLLIV
jgi:hypothetical protein